MANYFLGSVGRAEAFRTVGKKLELAFVSKTLTDSNVNISTSVDDIRAGQGAPVVARFAHDANVEITLTDVMFKNAYVESQLGTRFVKGGDAFKTETLTASSGKLTLSAEPKELNNSCFESGFKGVWATPAGKDAWRMYEADSTTVDLGDATASGDYCVRYLAHDDRAEVAEIYSDLVPSELYLIITMPLYAGDACSASNGHAAGEVQFEIPRFQLNGAQEFAAAMSSNQTSSLNGVAMASTSGCGTAGSLLKIRKLVLGEDKANPVKELRLDTGVEEGDDIVIYGIKEDGTTIRMGADLVKITKPADGKMPASLASDAVTATWNSVSYNFDKDGKATKASD